jgi:hypothetical protein
MRKSNTEDLVNIHQYHNKLAQTVDDAEWIGDYDKADFLNDHLKHVKEMMDRGELYYPLF